ncbi:aldehyde dehydrogenase family protein, partial [Paenarthrobacter ureafaciens]|uniref:aldehyde dehydrogenase family protein n=1 Tax=Paenarthrobacter ureafaciens TaxID=37931 RepID=UPI00397D4667
LNGGSVVGEPNPNESTVYHAHHHVLFIKPARQARRSGAVMVEALWEAFDEAGIGREVLQYVQEGKRELGTALVSHPSVDRLILTGGYETAELFRSFRKDLPLLAETSGKNAIIVTPNADLDLAARDVVQSAFGGCPQGRRQRGCRCRDRRPRHRRE